MYKAKLHPPPNKCWLLREFIKFMLPSSNEIVLTSVNLDVSEVIKFYNLDEIDRNPTRKP